MSYWLGIDLGTTYTAAAVWRDGRVHVVDLGTRAPVVPSVVLLRDDGELIVGEAAERRAATEPERVAREFKRRIGDPTPVVLAGAPVSADALTARLLRWTVDKVAESESGPASGMAVSHPANWGDYKQELLRQAIRQADLDDARMLSEPEAAAIHYASQERLAPGSVVAVYDLGGGTFDATVLRQADGGWDILGEPEGIERLGGIDFDEAVFQHVVASLGDAVERLDPDDPAAAAAVARLRRECVAAKEALAADTDALVPVVLPSVQTEVRVTRSEFEDMIRPSLTQSVAALRRALRAAGVEADDVHAVLLVGGSSRIPLVAELVSAELGRPIAVDAHPKHGVALGAAMVAAGADPTRAGAAGLVVAGGTAAGPASQEAAGRSDPGEAAGAPEPGEVARGSDTGEPAVGRPSGDAHDDPTDPIWAAAGADGGEPPPREPPPVRSRDGVERGGAARRRSRVLVGALASAAILVVGGGVAMALTGGGGDADGSPPDATTTTVAPGTTAQSTTEPSGTPSPTTNERTGSQSPTTSPTTTSPSTTESPTTTTPSTTTTSTTPTTAPTTTTTAPDEDPSAQGDEAAEQADGAPAAPATG
jgi:molecular chaperone DnaK